MEIEDCKNEACIRFKRSSRQLVKLREKRGDDIFRELISSQQNIEKCADFLNETVNIAHDIIDNHSDIAQCADLKDLTTRIDAFLLPPFPPSEYSTS